MKTKADLLAENDRLSKENAIMLQAVNAIANGEAVSIGKKGDYSLSLIHPNRAHGGIVLIRFAPKGQRPYQSAEYFEEWIQHVEQQAAATQSSDALALRDLAYQCRRIVHREQMAA